ncbi:MAG: helix-turn-helix transcriptional regulator [Bacilli bacterium]
MIREFRKAKGLTQSDLAKLLNETQKNISNWELGISEPSISSLIRLSIVLDVTIDALVGNSTEDLIMMSRKDYESLVLARDSINRIELANKKKADENKK